MSGIDPSLCKPTLPYAEDPHTGSAQPTRAVELPDGGYGQAVADQANLEQLIRIASALEGGMDIASRRNRTLIHGQILPMHLAGQGYTSHLKGALVTAEMQNVLACVPYLVGRPALLVALGVEVVTSGSGAALVELAIYDSLSADNPFPGRLLLSAGQLSAATPGFKVKTVNLQLSTPRVIWIAWATNEPGGVKLWRPNTAGWFILLGHAGPNVGIGGEPLVGWASENHVFGQIPDPFPTGASVATCGAGSHRLAGLLVGELPPL